MSVNSSDQVPVSESAGEDGYVIVGRISGLYGVKGWVKIYSHSEPRKNILRYSPWYLRRQGQWRPYEVEEGRAHGKGVVAKLVGYNDRDQVAELLNTDIAVRREQLPRLNRGTYYWTDLIGLSVATTEGVELGTVDYLFETGANDVIVVKGERERLIPYIREQVVIDVDLEAGLMTVDWDPDF